MNNKSSDNSHSVNGETEADILRDILKREMKERRLSQKDFATLLDINTSYLSEILSGKKSGERKALQFLIKLNMSPKKDKPGCPLNCDETLREFCRKVKNIRDYGTPYKEAIEANILCFEDSITVKRDLKNLRKTRSKGRKSGTTKRQVGGIG